MEGWTFSLPHNAGPECNASKRLKSAQQFLRRTDTELDARKRPVSVIVREHPQRPLKGKKATRTVPIPPSLQLLIASALRGTVGTHLRPERWRRSYAKKRWQHVRKTKVKVTIHSLRHTYGCRLVDAGVPARDISDLMGHEDIATAQRNWGTRDKRERAAQAMEKAAALFELT